MCVCVVRACVYACIFDVLRSTEMFNDNVNKRTVPRVNSSCVKSVLVCSQYWSRDNFVTNIRSTIDAIATIYCTNINSRALCICIGDKIIISCTMILIRDRDRLVLSEPIPRRITFDETSSSLNFSFNNHAIGNHRKKMWKIFLAYFCYISEEIHSVIRFQSGFWERKGRKFCTCVVKDFLKRSTRRVTAAASAQGGKSSICRPVSVTYELFKWEDDVIIDWQLSPALVRRIFYFFIQRFVFVQI